MKKQGLIAGFALAAAMALSGIGSASEERRPLPVGYKEADGTIYAGFSPDTNKPMYTTATDAPGIYKWSKGAAYCSALAASDHQGWHMPTKGELNVLFQNRAAIGGFNETGSVPDGWYWSSSQTVNLLNAWGQRFSDGTQDIGGRNGASSLRCVR